MGEKIAQLDAVIRKRCQSAVLWQAYGRVSAVNGHSVKTQGLRVKIGDWCNILSSSEATTTKVGDCAPSNTAEVVGFVGLDAILMPLSPVFGIAQGDLVCRTQPPLSPELTKLRGRVVNGLNQPLDARGAITEGDRAFVHKRINPLLRRPIDEVFDVGVRAINGLLTLGVGQRVGLFAGSGVGKSMLLGMIARYAKADIVVVGLIGERGREVQDFVANSLGVGLENTVVIASPADDPPALRLRAARLASETACHYRAAGHNVLLLMDSLTRVAQAQREIGLAAGEPPTSKGYPPSVFSLLPTLVEQAGSSTEYTGSITAIYTVLVEEDDLNDPLVDSVRSILDGHIVLSRLLADQGHYPAIDIEASISRLQHGLQNSEQRRKTQQFRQLWSRYAQQEDLIAVGAYEKGADPILDDAILKRPAMQQFLQQSFEQAVPFVQAVAELQSALTNSPAAASKRTDT